MGEEAQDRLLAVFGRDPLGMPMKRTLFCSDLQQRDQLRDLVNQHIAADAGDEDDSL